jgi:nicotinamide-nucleotide amidase
MKKVSIVTIGNELLNGNTADSNLVYLAKQLYSAGVSVVYCQSVPDDIDGVVRALERAAKEGDIVLVTGGLGPTDDDITRNAIAEFMNVELEFCQDAFAEIDKFFKRRGIEMSEINKRQAYIPVGCEWLINNAGTAPGIKARRGEMVLFSMPGVPTEMKQMFAGCVLPELEEACGGQVIVSRKIHCFGAGESTIAKKLGNLMERDRRPLVNCTVANGVINLQVVYQGGNREDCEREVGRTVEEIQGKLGKLIFGYDGQSLGEALGRKLVETGKTVSVAESCTGGLISKMITDVAGASSYFKEGFVTYSNEAKIRDLNVESEVIEKYGAVSSEVAAAMSKGVKNRTKSDYSVGVTGIAGPGGGNEHKPTGLVYIGVCSDNKCHVKQFRFIGDRQTVRLRAGQQAINMLYLLADV